MTYYRLFLNLFRNWTNSTVLQYGMFLKKGLNVSVYKYMVVIPQREDAVEQGTVVASSETETKRKLRQFELVNPKLKEIRGISGLIKRFTADIK